MTARKMCALPLLIATDSPADAQLISSLLEDDFSDIRQHLDSSRAPTENFFGNQPGVLVLAFKSLANAENYYLQIFSDPANAPKAAHKSVVLCAKDAGRLAYDACRRGLFDDYVVFWPFSDDVSRLPMALHAAAQALENAPPPSAEAAAATLPPSRVDGLLNSQLASCREQIDAASRSLDNMANDIKNAPAGATAQSMLPKVEDVGANIRELSQRFETVHGTIDGRINPAATKQDAPVVLVAEDDDYQSKMIGKILENAGYCAVFAHDGAEAVALVGTAQPDVVLLDYTMPELNGIQVLEKMAANPPQKKTPVIMVTGNSQRNVILDSRRLGVSEYLVKPFPASALLAKISRTLSTTP